MMNLNLSTMKRAKSLSVLLAAALAAVRAHAQVKGVSEELAVKQSKNSPVPEITRG